ncbi:DUF732 domain-containing protein [Mycobacterium eburneum]|nr:DUF732 domain-containing protein [Mycobacterium eburneum]TDH57553.1 DUF732 domain-containing protein [Mycobacterium eburneum]
MTVDDDATQLGETADAETTVVPPVAKTAPAYAWSDTAELDDAGDTDERPRWRHAATWAASIVVLAAAVTAVVWFSVQYEAQKRPVAQPAPVVVHPSPAPPVAPSPPPTHVPTHDELFVQALQADGLTIYNQPAALSGAHWVCAQFDSGRTKADMVAADDSANEGLSPSGLAKFIGLSVDFYCPQYTGQL